MASAGVDFLGYVIRPHYRLARRRVAGNLWARLRGLRGKLVHVEGPVETFDVAAARREGLVAVLNSYLGHFRLAKSAGTLVRMARAFPWLARFVVLRAKNRGWVAEDRWATPKEFPNLWLQWAFFRRLATARDPESLVFFRVGRHFELYEEQAEVAEQALGLRPVATRPGFEMRRGFRRERLDAFVRRAVGQGLTVVLVEETGKPLARIKERAVTRVHVGSRDTMSEQEPDAACQAGAWRSQGGGGSWGPIRA